MSSWFNVIVVVVVVAWVLLLLSLFSDHTVSNVQQQQQQQQQQQESNNVISSVDAKRNIHLDFKKIIAPPGLDYIVVVVVVSYLLFLFPSL